MTRRLRIAFELLGPGFIGTVLLLSATMGRMMPGNPDARSWTSGLLLAGYVLLVAYMCTGIQSIAYALSMEWRFRRGLDPTSWRSVRLSTALGFASGVGAARLLGDRLSQQLQGSIFWGGLGLVVGFLMGLLIRWWTPVMIPPLVEPLAVGSSGKPPEDLTQ